jgi:hypothetical protein
MPRRAGKLLAFLIVLGGTAAAPADDVVSPLPPRTARPAAAILLSATVGAGRPGGATATRPPTPAHLNAIAAWLASEFARPAMDDAPAVEFAAPRRMIEVRLGGGSSASVTPDLVAAYDDRTRTIYLPQGWTGGSAAELSVLVHEMVHHLQNSAGASFECAEAREKPAYEAQARWLAAFGSGLGAEFGIDPLTLLVRTSCLR